MQPINEGIIFNHMADEKNRSPYRLSTSQVLLFVAEESIMLMIMLSMIFLM
ncbi:MAG: hypothetical protein ABI772_00070 [Bacteroidota bacterium]